MTKTKTPSPPRILPALMVTLAVLLGLKAVAFAESATDVAPTQAPPPGAQKNPSEPAGAAGAGSSSGACATTQFADAAGLSPSEVQVLQSLGVRRASLDARATEMDTRQELLAAAERRVEERIAELKRVEARVQALTGQVDEAQTQRIKSLVDVYQRMRAKDAAAVFDALDQDVLVEVASNMNRANLAEVMGKMSPTRARQLTQWLANAPGANAAPAPATTATPPAPSGQTKAR